MPEKRAMGVKPDRKAPAGGAADVITREDFESVIRVLRQDLQTQFTRIAQLQQEIDELKRKYSS